MPYTAGKTLMVSTLLLVCSAVFIFAVVRSNPSADLVDSTILAKSGINNLDVEYVDGKIYLNVELLTPTTCSELIKSLKIQPIIIKSRTYQPTCSKISDTLMRVTYTHLMAS